MQILRFIIALVLAVAIDKPPALFADEADTPTINNQAPPVELTAREDHQRLMRLLNIESLRPGANGNDNTAPNAANYDESKANPYRDLPEPLTSKSGQEVSTPEMWWNQRRSEIVEDFDREVYGRVPRNVPRVNWEVTSTSNGTNGDVPIVTKELVGHVDNSAYPLISVDIELMLTTPANAPGPVPVIMEFGFNFARFNRNRLQRPGGGGPGRTGPPGPTWQQQVLAKGWGYATITPSSIQADNGQGLTRGIIGLVTKGQPRQLEDWGALRAWAWGASRALDYFESDPSVDAKQVGIEGLSRYGKAALLAMAYDQRFAIGFIGSSGAGGAKLHRRTFGELVENLASSGEYHWMAGNFLKYAGPLNAGDLPVDAHELIALCAPRPVFISYGASSGPGAEGQWVDQRGSFMAAVAAGPVYRLLGMRDLGTSEFPPLEAALVDGELAFRQHSGGHTTGPNWPTFLRWADRYIKGPNPAAAKIRPVESVAVADPSPSSAPNPRSQSTSAAQPVPQSNPLFLAAHQSLLQKKSQGVIDIYFLGDSITRRWQGTDYPEHKRNWDANFHGWNAANFGWGGDTTQNVLWRLENGELDGVHPRVVVLMIGTNNVGNVPFSDEAARVEDIANGIHTILGAVRNKAPAAKIILMGITPRNDAGNTAVMPTIDKINEHVSTLADRESVVYVNINDKLADSEGRLLKDVTSDGLHLSITGYQIWADALKPIFTRWLGQPAQVDKAPPASGVPSAADTRAINPQVPATVSDK